MKLLSTCMLHALCVLFTCHRSGAVVDMVNVFSSSEVSGCVRLRTPEMLRNERTGGIHVIARCCGANRCSSKGARAGHEPGDLGDNNSDCKVIMKSTMDVGKTWTNFQVLSPPNATSYANGAGIYDRFRDQIIVQYSFIPLGSTRPAKNVNYFQIVSRDDAASWSSPRNITALVAGCNPDENDMMLQSAGTKLQSSSGRLIWPAHAFGDRGACVWYSDDGGETYNTTAPINGNELSITVANRETNELYMTGRPVKETSPRRADYRSYDDGATWSKPAVSDLKSDDGHGCERSLININDVLYSAEPEGHKRTNMVVRCSKDHGNKWNSSKGVNGDNGAGYSDMVALDDHSFFLVWENTDNGNFHSATIDAWCNHP